MGLLKIINKSFGTYEFRGISIEPTYWQAAAIVILLFLLVFTLARLRFIYVHWSVSKGALSFLFYGFLIAIILEGFLLLSGRTILTEVLGWKNAPKPLGTALDLGRDKLRNVLGAKTMSAETLKTEYDSLRRTDREKFKDMICKP